MQGYLQVYTGDGKGKTTAALGVALRAAGAGKKVYIGQFIKNAPYSELESLKLLSEQIRVEQYGLGCFLIHEPEEADIAAAKQGVDTLLEVLQQGEYDVVIADEVCVALACRLLTEEDLIRLAEARPAKVELIFTGRGAPEKIIAMADLVTEMHCVKHYYEQGVLSRKGIDS
ncbi:cob(I)yrinic acid a,c-diamide adenosyltransferase [Desulfogranum japonicum]|uniref:cob(I)yrinic acid a,c-diamide adenosyltransferase n=1 Tax=Desulfogranum japonicum TaxID=231447 RepID=UPI0004242845|nr:cob(I)yrinic acid a,c-diamide adenosyltransferase [Desulfogranum japonicum]